MSDNPKVLVADDDKKIAQFIKPNLKKMVLIQL